jgi:hypothetical protein
MVRQAKKGTTKKATGEGGAKGEGNAKGKATGKAKPKGKIPTP